MFMIFLFSQIRWVVESANGRIKRFRYLDQVMPNNQIPFIGDFVRIVCAIANKYFPPLTQASEDEVEVASKMLSLAAKSNSLKEFIEEEGLDKKVRVWKTVEECDIPFPRLSEEQLCQLTLGVYQMKLAPSYAQEHVHGEFEFRVHVDDASLITIRLQSRHTSSRRYLVWIRTSSASVDAWYCQCRAGARVVGTCSHVAAIAWYLGHGRYQDGSSFGVRDWGEHLADAALLPVDSSDSE